MHIDNPWNAQFYDDTMSWIQCMVNTIWKENNILKHKIKYLGPSPIMMPCQCIQFFLSSLRLWLKVQSVGQVGQVLHCMHYNEPVIDYQQVQPHVYWCINNWFYTTSGSIQNYHVFKLLCIFPIFPLTSTYASFTKQ